MSEDAPGSPGRLLGPSQRVEPVEVLDPGQRAPQPPGRRRGPAPPSVRTVLVLSVAAVVVAALWRTGRVTTDQLVIFGVIIPSIMLHEVAHGWVALAFGDDTAKAAGRLTFNPLAHVDLVGTILVPGLMILSGFGFFGWAKPVPVNLARLRSPRNQSVLVSLAGPATNVALAASFAVLFHLTGAATVTGRVPLWLLILFYGGLINVWLAAFNLLPVPPLDGSVLVERLLPRRWWPSYLRLRPYTLPLLVVLVLLLNLSGSNLLVGFENDTVRWWGHVVGLP